jgi:hypothetical protein
MNRAVRVGLVSACLVASTTSVPAIAYVLPPLTVAPPSISGIGADVEAVFAYSSASFQDQAFLTGTDTPLFINYDDQYPMGYTVDLGVRTGSLVFGFDDLTTDTRFLMNVAAADGYYHVLETTDINSLINPERDGAMPAAVAAELSSLTSETPVVYLAFEDLLATQGSDFDYNDLILALTNVDPPQSDPVPEPPSLGLLLAGLTALYVMRRRSRS